MKTATTLVGLLVSMALSPIATGNEPDVSTAQGLLDACQVELKPPNQYPDSFSFMTDFAAETGCAYYLAGYLDAHRVTSGLIETNEPLFCLPDVGVSPDMVASALAAFLKQSPESSGDPSRTTLAISLRMFFPCDAVE